MPQNTRDNLFIHALGHLEYGKTKHELDQTLNECIRAAQATGKQAEITLKLSIKPSQSGAQVFITGDIKAKIPKFQREATIFFPTEDGDLKRNDPRQNTLPDMKIADDDKTTNYKIAKTK